MTEQMELVPITVEVNGTTVERSVEPRSVLVDFLRDDLGLTGTKVSCQLQVCGVCTVLVEGRPVSACTYLTVDADGQKVMTVEGLSDGRTLHPLQEAFVDCFALQCGFCTPGFLMMSKALLDSRPDRGSPGGQHLPVHRLPAHHRGSRSRR
jgi:aerobic-type carbon monoxide dehydrogenase small subunit (CoxS/CutS family)